MATPNIPEAEILSGTIIRSQADIENAARKIGDAYGCAVLLKGGHNINDANDFLSEVKDYYDRQGIAYDPKDFPDCGSCEGCHR